MKKGTAVSGQMTMLGGGGGRRGRRQGEVALEILHTFAGRPFQPLVDGCLDQPQPQVRHRLVDRTGQPPGPPAAEHGQQRQSCGDAGPGAARRGVAVGQGGRQRSDQHRHQRQTVNAEERHALQNRQHPDPAIADQVPREAGEDMAAQPFPQAPAGGEQQRPRQPGAEAAAAQQVEAQGGAAAEHRQQDRQADRRQRQGPPESFDVGEQRSADPVESQQVMAEAEEPADREGALFRPDAVQQPDQPGKRHQQHRQQIGRRQRQRGESAQSHRGDHPAPSGQRGQPRGDAAQPGRDGQGVGGGQGGNSGSGKGRRGHR